MLNQSFTSPPLCITGMKKITRELELTAPSNKPVCMQESTFKVCSEFLTKLTTTNRKHGVDS